MIAQPDLFSQPPAQRHSSTSLAAAESIKPHVTELQARVLRCIQSCGPISDQAIAVTLGLSENTARPRRIELTAAGFVRAAPELVTNASGRKAVGWISDPSNAPGAPQS